MSYPDNRGKRSWPGDEAKGETSRENALSHGFTPNLSPLASNPASSDHRFRPGTSRQDSTTTSAFSSSTVQGTPSLGTGATGQPQRGNKVAIPALRPPRDVESSAKPFKKGRTQHACDQCRKAKAGCTGETPVCLRCRNIGAYCQYNDGKRETDRKTMSKLSRETETLTQHKNDVTDALRRIELNTTLSTKEMRVAIKGVIAMTSTSISPGKEGAAFSQSRATPEPGDPEDDEYDSAEMGSTGSLDVVNVDIDREDLRATGHMGKSSSVAWAQRSADECRQSSSQNSSLSLQDGDFNLSSYHTDELDMEIIDPANIDPYEWPDPGLAQTLFTSYFDNIHDAFPILNKEHVTANFRRFTPGPKQLSEDDAIFLGTMNLIFAITSYHALLRKSDYGGHSSNHLVYCERAKFLCLDGRWLLYGDVKVSTVCAMGLLCLYYTATCRLNRAWTMCGLAIRNALTLGLHVRNEAEDLPDVEKEHRVRIWWSLYSLECLLNELTGRPSCISDRDISQPFPLNIDDSDLYTGRSLYEREVEATQSSRRGSRSYKGRLAATYLMPSDFSKPLSYSFDVVALPITSATYFIYRTQLSIISHQIVTQIYCAATIKVKWTEVQAVIRLIDSRLKAWKDKLPEKFNVNFDPSMPLDRTDPYLPARTGLAMFYNSSLMVLFRPFLCRFELRLRNQSDESYLRNQEGAEACILSAREMIALISRSSENLESLYSKPSWWNTLHYLCEALSVLMLEMAFRTKHMPEQTDQIFEDAKKGVKWLSMMAERSISARKAWEVFEKLIRVVAPTKDSSFADMGGPAGFPPGYSFQRYANLSSQKVPSPHELSRANPHDYQHEKSHIFTPDATNNWTASSHPFSENRAYEEFFLSQEHMRNPLDQMEALSRFSSIGNVHGLYDDQWPNPLQQLLGANQNVNMYVDTPFGATPGGDSFGIGAGTGIDFQNFNNLGAADPTGGFGMGNTDQFQEQGGLEIREGQGHVQGQQPYEGAMEGTGRHFEF